MKILYRVRLLHIGLILLFLSSIAPGCKLADPGKKIIITVGLDFGNYIRNRSNDPDDSMLCSVIQHSNATKGSNQSRFFDIFRDIVHKEMLENSIVKLFVKQNDNTFSGTETNGSVVSTLNNQCNYAIKHTVEKLTARVSGVVRNSSVVYDPEKEIIIVTFNGEENLQRVRSCIRARGNLQFFEAYSNPEIISMLIKANDTLSSFLNRPSSIAENSKKTKSKGKIKDANDTASLKQYSAIQSQSPTEDEKKKEEIAVKRNPVFALMQPSVNAGGNVATLGPVIGYVLRKDTGKLNKVLAIDIVKAQFPVNSMFLYGNSLATSESKDQYKSLQLYLVKKPDDEMAKLDGGNIKKAFSAKSEITDKYEIVLYMDSIGEMKWAGMTERSIGNYIAVVFDGLVFSCPRVDNAITNGKTEISGTFTEDEAADFANILMSGTLPIPVRIIATNINE